MSLSYSSLIIPSMHWIDFSRLPSTDQVIIRMCLLILMNIQMLSADKGLKFKDGSLVRWGTVLWHLLDPSSEGMPQVCHGRPALWNAKKSLASVFTKAFMWLEAFEHHLKTGSTLDTYLRHQPNRA